MEQTLSFVGASFEESHEDVGVEQALKIGSPECVEIRVYCLSFPVVGGVL